jgi:aspartate aminotransferase
MAQSGIKDIISFGGGEPPFDTPVNIQDAAIEWLRKGKTKYEPTSGDYDLRVEICTKFRKQNHIQVSPDEILVTPGAKMAVYMAMQALLEPGDRILVIEPAWVSYVSMAQLAGGDAIRVPSYENDGFQPDLDQVKKAMNRNVRLIVINNPCNPTGAVYSRETLRGLSEIAQKWGALVLSDEIYEDIIYEGTHYSPASEYDNVITVNGFSKSFAMTGWRLGYVAAPREIIDGMIKIYQQSATCVNAFSQGGAIEALRNPKSREETLKMAAGYKERCDLICDLMKKSGFFKGFLPPQGAFYVFPSYTFSKSSLEVATILLEKAHIATVPGSAFGECGEGHLRFAYSTSPENIIEGFSRIDSVAKDLL